MEKKAYYNRVMLKELMDILKEEKYNWLIDFVKKHKELDFQTGSNENDRGEIARSWFSIYRGTGRVITLQCGKRGILNIDAAEAYKKLDEDFYKKETWENNDVDVIKKRFECLLKEINNDPNDTFGSYYTDKDENKKEGYYQTLISRRYSLDCIEDDKFIILDKEFVIGYSGKDTKNIWLQGIKGSNINDWKKTQENNAREAVIGNKLGRFPEDIGNLGTECDFLGIGKDGSIILLELKRPEDTQKIYLSPLQVGHYGELTKQLINNEDDEYWNLFQKNIEKMFDQKVRLGLINPAWALPELKKEIKLAVVVGKDYEKEENKYPTPDCKKRFKAIRDVVDKSITLYINDKDGTLLKEPW